MHPALLQVEQQDSPQPLVGIAKLASQGESIRQGHLVEYFTLPSRALLNRCTSARMPFTWTINPYRGCEFACKYCYARYTHEFMEMRDGVDFERKIYVKQQAAWLLRQELKKVKRGESISIGTATDPYQPAEKRFEVTRGILEELALHHGLEIGIVTKSDLVGRDVELLKRVAEHNSLFVNLTVTTLNVKLARILEPRAPRPDLRLECGTRVVRRRNQRRSDLRAGTAGDNRLARVPGRGGARDQRSWRQIHLRQSAVPEAVLGERVSAVSGEGVSAAGGGLSQTICRARLRQQGVQQAHFGADGAAAQEARHHPRIQLAQPERPSAASGGRAVAACSYRKQHRCGRPW